MPETKLSYISGRYIQNPDIFRVRSTFRTLVYSKPKAYPEHCQSPTMESFVKNNYLAHFSASALKIFSLKKFLIKPTLKKSITFFQKKAFLVYSEMEPGLSSLITQKFSLKKFVIFFLKKPALKRFLIFS